MMSKLSSPFTIHRQKIPVKVYKRDNKALINRNHKKMQEIKKGNFKIV